MNQSILQHDFFSNVWKSLSFTQKDLILDILASGKGAIPYEKIVDIYSLDISPENNFLLKMNFIAN